ncbi:hypothetical protein L226DRAFT_81735 [Lentinus tigrinus ALCF2SS1-7]|uniref:F-box domain-containing protein n=1 Tax=Lentinus tigrinus ALCF2SS1-6 TaxID=1328759 RepID=A0A5C2RT65_9APHY|nr:hypothetical protein L227DRAFT_603796 [Lentinus tigrinus ALCF2SS1-6]RPD74088.1 hypothetical protein L226DRAFT_81735 [Lentinus tigrinus ALCF2SS1-7]
MPPGEKQKELHAHEARVLPRGAVTNAKERAQVRTIQDVPVELLLEIFRIHATRCKDTGSPTAWMGILLVCRYWHRVACDAAELWRVIHVGKNTDWFLLCLKRSARSLMDLHFSGLPTATVEAAVALVIPHAQRIRAIHLTGHGWLSADVCTLFAQPLPALEELSILPAEWRSPREAKLVPWDRGYRGLHSLALSGVSIPRDPAFYCKLRTLELHERCCTINQFTIDDLVLVLNAAASTLEELDLSRFQPIFDRDTQSAPKPPLPNVCLSRLRGFYLYDEFPIASHLNKHLTLPRGAFLHLRVYVMHADQLRYTNGTAVLADIVPPGVRHVLDDVTDLAVSIDRNSYSIRAPSTSLNVAPSSSASDNRQGSESDGPPIDRVRIDTLGWIPDRKPGLRAVLTVYTSGRLTSLSITLGGSEYTLAEWRTLFGAFRMLEKLAIVDHSHLDPTDAFVALSASTDSDPGSAQAVRGDDRALSGSVENVLCPALRTLHLEGRVQGHRIEALFDALCSALRTRAGLGLRLEFLCVDCSRASGLTCAELGVHASVLKPLVKSLVVR